MDVDILQRVLQVFSEENTKLKKEIESLRSQLAKKKTLMDDSVLDEVFKDIIVPQPIEAEIPKLKPAPITPTEEQLRKKEEMRAYQKAYREKRKAEKESQ